MTVPERKRVLEVVMKTCPACGLDVEDSYLFCPDDGTSLAFCPDDGTSLAETNTTDFSPTTDSVSEAQPAGAGVEGANSHVFVLYCGECAAEYPMTFVKCPVHHVPLTRQMFPTFASRLDKPSATSAPADLPPDKEPKSRTDHLDQLYERPSAGAPSLGTSQPAQSLKALASDVRPEQQASGTRGSSPSVATLPNFQTKPATRSGSPSILWGDDSGEDYGSVASSEPVAESVSRFENSSFRIVAATIVVALVLFCIVAVYIFFSDGGRRQPVAHAAQPSSTTAVIEPPPFIPTPEAALDYKEESAASPTTSLDSAPAEVRREGPARTASLAATNAARNADLNEAAKISAPKAPAPAAIGPTPVFMDRTSNAAPSPTVTRTSTIRDVDVLQSESARVDARLIRVRSMRTSSGVRYDLTFDLQDESGRHAQWERMLISTRSASGVGHTQAIPFVHRLGARGALTFTVSVEMPGHSQADWQGRVVCTTTGSDNDGKPLRASFGANVTP